MNGFRRDIVQCGKKIVDLGLVKATSGNISLRGDNSFFVTPSGYPLSSLSEELIVEVDSHGNVLHSASSGACYEKIKPSMETKLHLAVYNAHPTAKAIVHAHPLYATIIGTITEIKPLTYEAAAFIYPIDYVPPVLPGTPELADYVGKTQAKVIVLKNHGVVVWGETLAECIFRMQVVEENAEQIFVAKSFGKMPESPLDEVLKLS